MEFMELKGVIMYDGLEKLAKSWEGIRPKVPGFKNKGQAKDWIASYYRGFPKEKSKKYTNPRTGATSEGNPYVEAARKSWGVGKNKIKDKTKRKSTTTAGKKEPAVGRKLPVPGKQRLISKDKAKAWKNVNKELGT